MVERALAVKPAFPALVRAAHLRHLQADNTTAKQLYARAIRMALAAGQRLQAAWATAEVARIFQAEGDAQAAAAGFALSKRWR